MHREGEGNPEIKPKLNQEQMDRLKQLLRLMKPTDGVNQGRFNPDTAIYCRYKGKTIAVCVEASKHGRITLRLRLLVGFNNYGREIEQDVIANIQGETGEFARRNGLFTNGGDKKWTEQDIQDFLSNYSDENLIEESLVAIEQVIADGIKEGELSTSISFGKGVTVSMWCYPAEPDKVQLSNIKTTRDHGFPPYYIHPFAQDSSAPERTGKTIYPGVPKRLLARWAAEEQMLQEVEAEASKTLPGARENI